MRVKTNLKAGKAVQNYLDDAGRVIKQAGQEAGQVAESITQTVTNPKFWTWPW